VKSRFAFTKRRRILLATVIICAALITSLIVLWQTRPAAQAAIINPHPGLVGWWRFDEGTGTVAGDSSGNGNNGTLINSPTWVTGKYGYALRFSSASTQYVATTLSPQAVGTPITISGWIYFPNDPGNHEFECGFRDNNVADFYVLQLAGSNTLELRFRNSVGVAYTLNAVITPNSWCFVALTYDGSKFTAYINGVPISSTSASGTFGTSSYPFEIGASGGTIFPTDATIDDVRIYNRALSPTEIQANFQQSPDFSPYLLANVPKGTTQVITTLSWQGTGNINVTITTPSQTYNESMMSEYQKTTYSTTGGGPLSMLNIKRLSVSFAALTSAQSWNITLAYDNTVSAYQISVETQN
jgi:hypothetical protein